jgi:hypothetical protein
MCGVVLDRACSAPEFVQRPLDSTKSPCVSCRFWHAAVVAPSQQRIAADAQLRLGRQHAPCRRRCTGRQPVRAFQPRRPCSLWR